ncbi:hypothetical protein EIN_155400 [Entamoeba invadens IP1]|uniref:Uncharacterized protein n=1 Tax=Entamoeba invadens IP1 TaxID=370355 RepID=A0A0A1UCP5_ENTIV|nr:hypothetical protein EIN_155400 [Entamoeba invadens IP1]ELP91433.1 hypothetical protein EIN_155400 [Entamoeba invadens IP1]|eukprot:XP_004258204.1 hypothetical protein EIN_155400 [Entamoeba invadens IP1]
MIIDCVDIKVVPNNFEDDGLLQYPKETRNKIITEILFSLQANPNFFMEQSRILTPFRDRFNFTLSIIGACLHDGISTASERRVMACVEIYEKWLTQSPRPSFLTAEFLITMTNQLSMPFARATDIYDQNTRCSILNRISLLLRKITTTEYKTKSLQEDSEMFLYHMFKLHMMIIHAIVRMTYPVDHQCLKILSETFLTVMVSCKQTEEYQRTLGLFTRIAGKWIALSEFRTAFLAYHTKLQNEYLKVYKKFDKIPFIVPFSDDCSMGGLMLDEKHVRRLWVMNLQLFDVTNLEVDGLLELVKVFGENMAQALEREMSSRLIYKLYINTFFNIIKLYNHKKHQDSINFTIINVTNYFEKRSGEIAGDDFLLSRMILFFKHCFKSECVDILVCTMGSLDRLLQTHITELILVYKELVYTMFQLTSVFDTAKDKIPLMVIISTMNSLRYYFPILFACFGRVEKLFNLEELLYLHLAIFTTIEQLGFFGKNNCAIYFETVADFIGVFGKTWPDPTLLESYLISFEGTVKKSAKWMFQKYNSEEFVGLYRVFEEFYQILHRFSHPEKHIKSIVETLIKIIKGMIRCSSSEVIHCFIEKLVEFSVFDKNITDELFPEIIDLLMYLSNNDTALVKNNLKFITSFYYFFFSHPQKGMYYNLLDEKDMLLASKTNTDIQFNDKYNGLNKLSGNEFEANELNKTTVWREKTESFNDSSNPRS